MKLQIAKARFWLVALVMSGTTFVAAQVSSAPAVSPFRAYSGERDAPSVLSVGRPSELESRVVATAEPSLPDAPSEIAERQPSEQPPPSTRKSTEASPRPPIKTSFDRTFLVANGFLLGSTIANVELIARCQPSACQAVPGAIRSRGALYGIGIPASIGISYLSYRLKRAGTRLWIAPVALFTAGNLVYAVHASQYGQ